ncbi:hypothetical protein ACFQ1L_27070 [Phytohabitans flavus]|uniref:hypothetical protein n=1 Tax=Phytohabitans flavus TaxID=1076124 RepID=UPI0036326CA9
MWIRATASVSKADSGSGCSPAMNTSRLDAIILISSSALVRRWVAAVEAGPGSVGLTTADRPISPGT